MRGWIKQNNGSDAIGRIFAAGYTGRGSDTCDSRPKQCGAGDHCLV